MRGRQAVSALCLLFLGAALLVGSIHHHGRVDLRQPQTCAACAWHASPGAAPPGVSISAPIEPVAATPAERESHPLPIRELALPRSRAPPPASL
jgi:hypothetical protein